MNNFILSNLDSVITIILFVMLLLFMLKRGAIKQVNEMLFYLVSEAEKQFGGGTGALKYAAVTTWLYERLPLIIKVLFTPKQIDKLIEDAVEEMKRYLETNKDAKILILPPENALDL